MGIPFSGMQCGNTVIQFAGWEYRYSGIQNENSIIQVCSVVITLSGIQCRNTVFRYSVWEYRFQVCSV